MNLLKYFAYSKLNLGLQVLNRRIDGYHNINTVFYLINLFDEIEFSLSDKIEIDTIPDYNIILEENLIYQAAKLFFNETGINGGIKVKVKKNIPLGGGLAGGSSNAATTLIALNRLYNTSFKYSKLLSIASQIGSDCGFFIHGSRAAIGSGRGDVLQHFDFIMNYKIAIVNPGINVSTPIAYKLLNRSQLNENIEVIDFKNILLQYKDNPIEYRTRIFNDFENVIFDIHPEIKNIKDKLYSIGALFSLMSGSGSTVFGIFPDDYNMNILQDIFPKYFCHFIE